MANSANTLALVADIGGTNTRCALTNGLRVLPHTVRRYRNADHRDMSSVLARFLADEGNANPAAACAAVAGPVHDGVAHLTNLDWIIDRSTLAQATGAAQVAILNDLQAQGHAIGALAQTDLREVIVGAGQVDQPNAAKLVIGVGTGFNAAPVFDTVDGRFVPPSECGHATMPIRTEQDMRLAQSLTATEGFAAIEDVLSGRGLERIYAFLALENGQTDRLSAQEIMATCDAETNPLACDAVALFCRILGAVCGDLSLVQLPFGGVYLVGGVARAMAPYLTRFGFADSFSDKGRFSDFMQQFSVTIVDDDYAALQGCANYINRLAHRA